MQLSTPDWNTEIETSRDSELTQNAMEALNSLEMFPPINQLENILSTTTVQGDITNETDNNKMVDPTSPIPQKRAKRAVRTVSVSFCIYIYYLQYILRVSSFPFNFQFLSLSIYNLLQF